MLQVHGTLEAAMGTHDYEKFSGDYASRGFTGTDYLAFRDLPAR
jgi:hypothetical protein